MLHKIKVAYLSDRGLCQVKLLTFNRLPVNFEVRIDKDMVKKNSLGSAIALAKRMDHPITMPLSGQSLEIAVTGPCYWKRLSHVLMSLIIVG